MSDDQIQFIVGQLKTLRELQLELKQALMQRLDRMDQEHIRCKAQCDEKMPEIHKRMDNHICEHLKESKFNPAWIYAISTAIIGLIATIGLFLGLKGLHP